jgi:hypothetical protein
MFADGRRLSMIASDASRPLREPPRHFRRADVRRDDHRLVQLLGPVVAHERRSRVQMIDRNVKESLDLVGMKVHSQHAIGAGVRDHVRHQLRADRDARLVLTVLPGVPEVR